MKKLLLSLIIVASVFLAGCVTTQGNQSEDSTGFKPQINRFDEKDWITLPQVELYQDDDYLYLYINYTSDREGKFSIFNPPNGNSFKKLGDILSGDGSVLQGIEKSSLKNIEGITVFFYPGDFSNEGERSGIFIKNDEIRWDQIPTKPENLYGTVIKRNDIEPSQSNGEALTDSSGGDGSSPENAIFYEEYTFPEEFLSDLTEFSKQQKFYKWGGRFVRVEFVVSDKLDNFQNFIDTGDLSASYDADDITSILGNPLYYTAGDDILFSKDNLPSSYVMVYAAMWTGDPVDSLSVEVKDGIPVFIETKYYGWFTVNGFAGGQEFNDFGNKLEVIETIQRDEANKRIKELGVKSIDKSIVDYGKFASYTNYEKSYELTWEEESGTGIFIIHILLNNND